MTRLLLIRHGETDWNNEGRWHGQLDVPLNARGEQQAERCPAGQDWRTSERIKLQKMVPSFD
jgi:broad specificity phosphatase PhoE